MYPHLGQCRSTSQQTLVGATLQQALLLPFHSQWLQLTQYADNSVTQMQLLMEGMLREYFSTEVLPCFFFFLKAAVIMHTELFLPLIIRRLGFREAIAVTAGCSPVSPAATAHPLITSHVDNCVIHQMQYLYSAVRPLKCLCSREHSLFLPLPPLPLLLIFLLRPSPSPRLALKSFRIIYST